MYIAYVDESGNTGLIDRTPSGKGGTRTFTLGCLLIEDKDWLPALDRIIDFRRFLKRQYGLPIRAEVKANYLLGNRGPFRPLGLSEAARHKIYTGFMRIQRQLPCKTFAVVVRKYAMNLGAEDQCHKFAWEFVIQRLERFTDSLSTHLILMHDEGHGEIVRAIARKARRAGMAGSAYQRGALKRPFRFLVDDPVGRNSEQSYFIQLADLSAYAAFRRLYSPPPRTVQIVPTNMWDELQEARHADANKLQGGPAGIARWPK